MCVIVKKSSSTKSQKVSWCYKNSSASGIVGKLIVTIIFTFFKIPFTFKNQDYCIQRVPPFRKKNPILDAYGLYEISFITIHGKIRKRKQK